MGISERRTLEDHIASYEEGFRDGYSKGHRDGMAHGISPFQSAPSLTNPRKKRKPSAWNKFVKANSKKPRFKYRNGKLNLKKMAVAFRKTPAGKKKRR